ncbi:MAG TPA: preprotein translocase subunit YajC [Mycobacteriales bacterium]|nr:preprotein translocase subunit YajC [Mycobacteriales bacterium]
MEQLTTLLPLILLAAVFYLLILRPQRVRQRQLAQTQSALAPGARVMTTGGLYATVSAVEDDAVLLEVAPGVVCRYVKPAVARVLEQPTAHSDEPVT